MPFSGDIQNPSGCDPVQPTLGESTLAGALDQIIFQWPFHSQPVCDTVIPFYMVFESLQLPAFGCPWTSHCAVVEILLSRTTRCHRLLLQFLRCFLSHCKINLFPVLKPLSIIPGSFNLCPYF